jgi:hypothetical protein
VLVVHERPPVTKLPFWNESDFAHIFDGIGRSDVHTAALLDNPVGVFVWDLMDAFPNYVVPFTVRDVSGGGGRGEMPSLHRTMVHDCGWKAHGCWRRW